MPGKPLPIGKKRKSSFGKTGHKCVSEAKEIINAYLEHRGGYPTSISVNDVLFWANENNKIPEHWYKKYTKTRMKTYIGYTINHHFPYEKSYSGIIYWKKQPA